MAASSFGNPIRICPTFDRVSVCYSLRGPQNDCGGWKVASLGSEGLGAGYRDPWRGRKMTRNSSGMEFRLQTSLASNTGAGRENGPDSQMTVMEWDVVEYPVAASPRIGESEKPRDGVSGSKGVGVIVSLTEASEDVLCHIEPLRQKDPESKEWIEDEDQNEITVAVGQVRVLQAWYSQRMVADRIANPHGEHAENLWIIE